MLSYLADHADIWGPLRLLRFITLRTLMAAGTAALLGFIIGPWLITQLRALKFGQHYDDDRTGDLAQKFDKKNTPTMGGLLIFISVFFSTVLWAESCRSSFTPRSPPSASATTT
jgi:phospho-N-acetylmuramoyl-pentapeptide-transferase